MKTGSEIPTPVLKKLSVLAVIRTAYSSERSLLSWIRTSASLYTFGFSISKFVDYLGSRASDVENLVGLHRLGSVLIALGAVALVFAMIEHLKRMHTMKQLESFRTSPLSLPVVGATALLAVGLATLVPLIR
jgi:putative membrane protein